MLERPCVRPFVRPCVRPTYLVRAVTSLLIEGFSNNLAQLFTVMSRCVAYNNQVSSYKVKVTN